MNRLEELNEVAKGLTHLHRHYGFRFIGDIQVESTGSALDQFDLKDTGDKFTIVYDNLTNSYKVK